MNVIELARVVLECRHARQEYLRTRSGSALNESTRLEKKLDHCLAIILEGQQDLFAKDSPPPSGPHDAV